MYQEKIKVDWVTIWLWFGIMIFGWLNIYAAGYDADHAMLFDFSVQHGKQFIWMSIATLLALFIVFTEPRVFSNTAYPIYGIAMALLVVTLTVCAAVRDASLISSLYAGRTISYISDGALLLELD